MIINEFEYSLRKADVMTEGEMDKMTSRVDKRRPQDLQLSRDPTTRYYFSLKMKLRFYRHLANYFNSSSWTFAHPCKIVLSEKIGTML